VHCHCAKRAFLGCGAGDGTRTHDGQLGRLELYQLSYARDGLERGGRWI
jgi:hypothetical protein